MLRRLIRFYRAALFLGLDAKLTAQPLNPSTEQMKEFVLCFGHSKVSQYDPTDGRPRWWAIYAGPVVQFYTEEDPRGWLPLTPSADKALDDPVTALLAVQAIFGEVKQSKVQVYHTSPEKAVELFSMTGEPAIPTQHGGSKWLTNEDCAGWLTAFLTEDEPCLTQ